MSGLAAIIRTDGGPADRDGLARMIAAMAHKGPDGTAGWHDDHAALGHAALHTTQESCAAQQPLVSMDGERAVIMDGLLTNWDDLSRDLTARGVRLRTNSDAELILGAYSVWGRDCAQHFDGEFAFVLWDAKRHMALCGRDHQGLRPLIYTETAGRVVIASDQVTLNAGLGHQPSPNRDYLVQMAAAQFYSPDQTAAQGVFRVKPAHVCEISRGGLSQHRYWSLPTDVTIRYRRDADYAEHYRHVLTDCVRRLSRSHRPLALEVSGGLDSSATYCLAHELKRSGDLLAPSVRGYTLRGETGTASDEVAYARAAARHAGGTLREVPLFTPSLDWFVRQAASEQDLPAYTNGAMSITLEQAMVEDGCRASLGGTGGDQWLDGTLDYYAQHLRSFEWGSFCRAIARDAPALGAGFTAALAARQIILAVLPLGLANRLRRSRPGAVQGAAEDLVWLTQGSRTSLALGFDGLMERHSGDAAVERKRLRLERAELQLALDLMNRQLSRNHLEPRSPMFARAFVEFSAATPEHIRFRAGQTKWVHREAMREVLPERIVARDSKASFPAPELIKEAQYYCAAAGDVLGGDMCELDQLRDFLSSSKFDSNLSPFLWGIFASTAYLGNASVKSDKWGHNS